MRPPKPRCLHCHVRVGRSRGLCYVCGRDVAIRVNYPVLPRPVSQTGERCRHCGIYKASRPKGLCFNCSENPAIRNLYPSTSKFAHRSEIDFLGHHKLPTTWTDALNGSPEKEKVLTERAAAGVALKHPLDLTGDEWRDRFILERRQKAQVQTA